MGAGGSYLAVIGENTAVTQGAAVDEAAALF